MVVSPAYKPVAVDDPSRDGARDGSRDGGIAICVDHSEPSRRIIPHALALTGALGAPATLLHVLEVRRDGNARQDPVEWELLRREAHDTLERTAAASSLLNHIETELVEGEAAEQICRWAQGHSANLLVLGTSGEWGPNGLRLGKTVQAVIETAPGSVLLVPTFAGNTNTVRYRRILIPLDGSSRAESVLPLAIRLANVQDAELLLVHVVPIPELTEVGPMNAEDIQLRERLVGRNTSVAEQYLNRIHARVTQKGVAARALVLQGDDARGRLARLVTEESVDLIVISAQGRSCRRDVPYGSVTAHLINHLAVPMLIVRPQPVHSTRQAGVAMRPTDSCLPRQASL